MIAVALLWLFLVASPATVADPYPTTGTDEEWAADAGALDGTAPSGSVAIARDTLPRKDVNIPIAFAAAPYMNSAAYGLDGKNTMRLIKVDAKGRVVCAPTLTGNLEGTVIVP